MEALIGVYGASGCGRGVMPLLRQQFQSSNTSGHELVFIDDSPPSPIVNGHRCLTYAQFISTKADRKLVSLAIANGFVRAKLAAQCALDGIDFLAVYAENVVQMDDVCIGEGAILCPFVTLTSNIKIGKHFHANLYSYVEHDCVIGDFVTFAPAVKCNGNILIEDGVYVGAGAVIKQGRPGHPLVIGKGAVIGMGAVVTKNVPAGAVVVGNPARIKVSTGV